MHKFLIIQTAFTGDVVLATAIAERLHDCFPDARIDFLVRKGNEGLLAGHPYISAVLVWDKKTNKTRNLLQLAGRIRRERYSHVINPHRFGSSGFLTLLSGAPNRAGFTKNPFSFCYTRKIEHVISAVGTEKPTHEIERNQLLIADIAGTTAAMPALYPSDADYDHVQRHKVGPYVCVAPSSVWYTKQFPAGKWSKMIDELPKDVTIYIIGAPSDKTTAREVIGNSHHPRVYDLCGELNFLQSVALMKDAVMNYTNDSAPLHFASSINAPVTAVFCSTVPSFGFGPVRENGCIVETKEDLSCRPCGLHGHRTCPQGHFKCAYEITNEQLLWWTSKTT